MSIVLALPSKGRLKQQSIEALQKAGFPIVQADGGRTYRGTIDGHPEIEVGFLSASEISRELAAGSVDVGITGEDLIKENRADQDGKVEIKVRLGFGHADVVVAVPDVWFDVDTMTDLDDVAAEFRQRHGRRLRIATKYWRLTQQFFSRMHGIQVYRIVESLGATEGAPAAGLADVIVDITSTGSTLHANSLKILTDGVILKSQAVLAVSNRQRTEIDQSKLLALVEKVESPV